MNRIKQLRKKADEDREIEEAMAEAKKKRQEAGGGDDDQQQREGIDPGSDEGEEGEQVAPPARGRGRGGRGSRGGRGKGRGQAEIDTDPGHSDTKSPRGRGRGGGRGRAQKQAVVKETPQPKKVEAIISPPSRGNASRLVT